MTTNAAFVAQFADLPTCRRCKRPVMSQATLCRECDESPTDVKYVEPQIEDVLRARAFENAADGAAYAIYLQAQMTQSAGMMISKALDDLTKAVIGLKPKPRKPRAARKKQAARTGHIKSRKR